MTSSPPGDGGGVAVAVAGTAVAVGVLVMLGAVVLVGSGTLVDVGVAAASISKTAAADVAPTVAPTVWLPAVAGGTTKLTENVPLEFVVKVGIPVRLPFQVT
jgi:hypothetical protein